MWNTPLFCHSFKRCRRQCSYISIMWVIKLSVPSVEQIEVSWQLWAEFKFFFAKETPKPIKKETAAIKQQLSHFSHTWGVVKIHHGLLRIMLSLSYPQKVSESTNWWIEFFSMSNNLSWIVDSWLNWPLVILFSKGDVANTWIHCFVDST